MVVWWSFTKVESEKSPETNPNIIVRCPTSPNQTISLPFLFDFSMNMNTNCWLTHSCKIQVSKGPCNKPKKYYTPKNERMSPKNGTILKGPPLFGGTCVFFSGEVKRRPLPITFPKFRMDREHDGIQAISRWTMSTFVMALNHMGNIFHKLEAMWPVQQEPKFVYISYTLRIVRPSKKEALFHLYRSSLGSPSHDCDLRCQDFLNVKWFLPTY